MAGPIGPRGPAKNGRLGCPAGWLGGAGIGCGWPGGTYVGPDGRGEQRGHPRIVAAASKAYDEGAWRRLWEVSEQLTGIHYDFPGEARAA